MPSGVLAEKYGAKWVLGLGMLLCSILTLLTPLAARWSVWALVAARVLEGFGAVSNQECSVNLVALLI